MRRSVFVFLVSVGIISFSAGCAKTIDLTRDGMQVETLSHGYLRGERKSTCDEVAQYDVQVAHNEKSGSPKSTVEEIKARNLAAKKGATHILLWPEKTVPCDATGKMKDDGEKECLIYPVNAYTCVVGRHD